MLSDERLRAALQCGARVRRQRRRRQGLLGGWRRILKFGSKLFHKCWMMMTIMGEHCNCNPTVETKGNRADYLELIHPEFDPLARFSTVTFSMSY